MSTEKFQENPARQYEIQTDEDTSTGLAARVILYNDDWHTFDEVIVQLMKAVNCTGKEAESFAFEVHIKGSAVVFSGGMPECLRVAAVLEEIALHTQIVL